MAGPSCLAKTESDVVIKLVVIVVLDKNVQEATLPGSFLKAADQSLIPIFGVA